MPRLHLKSTLAEEEERARKRAKKAARKEKNAPRSRRDDYDDELGDDSPKRHRSRSASPRRSKSSGRERYYNYVPSAGDPGPSTSRTRNAGPGVDDYGDYEYDYGYREDETARARMEQERFEEKMRDALEDDGLFDPQQRLDGVEARLNSFSHIPRRWRGTDEGYSAGLWMEDTREDIGLEPWQMNDDEYAEYIQAGMWKKKNQAEFQERLRKKEERKARKERERFLREETRRLEKEAWAEIEQASAAKAKRRVEEAKRLYEERWLKLLERPAEGNTDNRGPLHFDDIPWPIAPPRRKRAALDVDDFTKEAISSFLLPPTDASADSSSLIKDILRSTMLKFHPDKFESRVLLRVREKDRDIVKEVAGVVVRVLNDLARDNTKPSS
ncbi:hypothetical protein DFH11DRAFT_1588860 [Phellopilus nigrolimitatus]|nr:hypothetical protein DFH11DRAFT_1588860 [Phellopilus nigrolimitatus]